MWLIFFAVILGMLLGGIFTLIAQWYYIHRYLLGNPTSDPPEPTIHPRVQLPRELLKILEESDFKKKESCISLNLILQFLFKEMRDTGRVRRWFLKKLSVEFEELLQRTTTGKLLEQVTVRSLYLGNQFPVIKSIAVQNLQLHESGYIEELDVTLDLDYTGGFQLAVNADMVLGRSAYLAVKLTRLKGQARLRLTRLPYTHWSFSFCDEPLMDFEVESHFQGRPLPQVTSLIINQIRRTVRKKHTFPNYKIRYKPFFSPPETPKPCDNVYLYGNKITEGLIDITVIECSRLFKGTTTNGSFVYCTLAIDSTAWVELVLSCSTSWVTRDLDLSRQPGQPLGIIFKQEFVLDKYENCVVVESVAPNSPASTACVQRGDILVAVSAFKVSGTSQATRLFKQAGDKLTVRIERRSTLKLSPSQESLLSRDDDSASCSAAGEDEGADDSTDSGGKVSPASKSPLPCSPAKKPASKSAGPPSQLLQRVRGASGAAFSGVAGDGGSPGSVRKNPTEERTLPSNDIPKTVEVEGTTGSVFLKRTDAIKFDQDPVFKESFTFDVEEHHQFLNVCVWCQSADQQSKHEKQEKNLRPEKDILLGHISILLLDVAMECASNSLGFHQQTFQLLPPEPKAVASRSHKLANHPGFDESLCYGDITLAFGYKPRHATNQAKDTLDSSFRDSTGIDSEDEGYSVLPDSLSTDIKVREHDFIVTQFHSAISCNFCSKKIWLKMAFQCRLCALVCHKKCVGKCQAATECSREAVSFTSGSLSTRSHRQPEIITTVETPVDRENDSVNFSSQVESGNGDSTLLLESPRTQRRLRSLLSTLSAAAGGGSGTHCKSPTGGSGSSGLTRTGSAHNLAPPPQQQLPTQSKSLPPSPQTSPNVSRKTSLQGNLFQTGQDSEPEEDVDTTVQRLLQYSNDEELVSAAKERGKELFSNFSLEERKDKLNSMVAKLQAEIDLETDNRNDLSRTERLTTDDLGHKTKISLLIAKSDEKIQALAILMLYYCSGLQHCQELEEALKVQAAKLVINAGTTESSASFHKQLPS